MTDTVPPTLRSAIMARIRSSGTKPEAKLGALLRELAPNESIMERPDDIPGRPDFWLPRIKLAIFADGCFFHACPQHLRMPANNRSYWEAKIARNAARDHRVRAEARRIGVHVARVWEHELAGDAKAARAKLRRALRRARGGSK
jgi:DNA mismatch endonuclease (patch repair protein)